MAMPQHVYRLRNMATGATVKRVGADSYYEARRLAASWVAALTLETGQHHRAEKVRNAYGSGRRHSAPARREHPAAAQFAALLAQARATAPGTVTAGRVALVAYTAASIKCLVDGKPARHAQAVEALGGPPAKRY